MTNLKITKKALLISAMAVVLCLVMLTGTTFAWFTDQETSANNRIVAGNLKVDLLMYKADDTTTTDGYVSIGGGSGDIFKEADVANNSQATLWEPGKTQVVFLAIENEGSLALKYNISVNVTDGGLIGALEYAIIDEATATSLDLSTTDWASIKAAYPTGKLVAGTTVAAENGRLDEVINGVSNERDYFALVVHMSEEADNAYMSDSTSEKNVVIDITVNATQVDAEDDSFGDDYDLNA